ncbi:phage tail family protein [Vagococcus fluvialis]|uniref:phage tail domain-containing protein n=1 Tax=Vagococcus fluvialis TaxID=2738 RepID=UPI001D0BDB9B|nr:phage tail domain-containing protein [Vagococcus fluvialis]UDM75059.1 phage tail family protein [Vagococcus fluvialis]
MKTIKFNNKELKVKSLKTTIQPLVGINNSLVSRNRSVSRRVSTFDTTPKMITLEFPFENQLGMGVSESISEFFYTDELAILINPKNEDRYFMAKVDGEIGHVSEGTISYYTIKFIVPNGVSQSVAPKRFPFTNGTANIQNTGTYKTPVDINVTFTSDANSIGFVSEDNIVQLGTSISEDEDNAVQSQKVMNDDMGIATRNLWSVNTGRVRWRYDDGDNTSRIQGALQWNATDVTPSSYGPVADNSKPGYWHGPTLTRVLTNPMSDFEAYHRIEFKPNGTAKEKPVCQGLLEINYSDSDNNFVMGFEIKDNKSGYDEVQYSFFIGDYPMFKGFLPPSVLTFHGGFFGSIQMKKIGNQFTFRLARINGVTWKETWSISKTFYNENVAMLSASVVNSFMSMWKNNRPMTIRLTHTRITQFATENEALIPKTFYSGDTLLVDGKSNRVYINGLRDDSYRVLGSSQVFNAEKGLTEVVAISDGSFAGFLEIEERYL